MLREMLRDTTDRCHVWLIFGGILDQSRDGELYRTFGRQLGHFAEGRCIRSLYRIKAQFLECDAGAVVMEKNDLVLSGRCILKQ